MKKIVCKFGGTSLSDSTQMEKVLRILKSNEERKIAILSAPGKRFSADIKITDLLYKAKDDDAALDKVITRFFSIERDLKISHSASNHLIVNRELIKSDSDFAASRGEYCSALLFSEYIGWEFIDAAEIIDIDENGKAGPETLSKIADKIESGKNYIIPGFYGLSKNKTIKTFSRGGSDITGALVARAVSADVYENWSDVSGVMMANPRIVENPRIIDTLSYDEIELLASYGAEVFHHDAVAPVKDLIPINIKNTNSPNDKGTIITSSKNHSALNPLSVSVKDDTVYVLGALKVIEECKVSDKDEIEKCVNDLYKKYFIK